MAHYIIEASHTDPECRAGLVAIGDRGMHLLHKAWFGCAAGVHTAWVDWKPAPRPKRWAYCRPRPGQRPESSRFRDSRVTNSRFSTHRSSSGVRNRVVPSG
jgi:hypothetical protein